MTVKGLHNLHNNMKAMEESGMNMMIQQNGNNNNNNLYKSGGGNSQPKSPSSPNAATVTSSIDNNFTRRETTPTKQTIEAIETNQGLVQLREKANAAAAAYERHDREREQMRNSQVEAEAAREKRASKEVSQITVLFTICHVTTMIEFSFRSRTMLRVITGRALAVDSTSSSSIQII